MVGEGGLNFSFNLSKVVAFKLNSSKAKIGAFLTAYVVLSRRNVHNLFTNVSHVFFYQVSTDRCIILVHGRIVCLGGNTMLFAKGEVGVSILATDLESQ